MHDLLADIKAWNLSRAEKEKEKTSKKSKENKEKARKTPNVSTSKEGPEESSVDEESLRSVLSFTLNIFLFGCVFLFCSYV